MKMVYWLGLLRDCCPLQKCETRGCYRWECLLSAHKTFWLNLTIQYNELTFCQYQLILRNSFFSSFVSIWSKQWSSRWMRISIKSWYYRNWIRTWLQRKIYKLIFEKNNALKYSGWESCKSKAVLYLRKISAAQSGYDSFLFTEMWFETTKADIGISDTLKHWWYQENSTIIILTKPNSKIKRDNSWKSNQVTTLEIIQLFHNHGWWFLWAFSTKNTEVSRHISAQECWRGWQLKTMIRITQLLRCPRILATQATSIFRIEWNSWR